MTGAATAAQGGERPATVGEEGAVQGGERLGTGLAWRRPRTAGGARSSRGLG